MWEAMQGETRQTPLRSAGRGALSAFGEAISTPSAFAGPRPGYSISPAMRCAQRGRRGLSGDCLLEAPESCGQGLGGYSQRLLLSRTRLLYLVAQTRALGQR